jgi:signal transduction histidine kinase
VLLDLELPDSEGLDAILRVRDQAPRVAIVVLTANDDDRLALRALKEGAQDYLAKGYLKVYRHLLERSIRYAIERKRAQEALRQARDELELRVAERTAELTAANRTLQLEIAERRRAEEAAVASQAKFQAFMDNSPAWAFLKDAAGRYLYVNLPFQQRSHTTLDHWLGKTDAEMWPAEIASRLREHDRLALSEDRTTETFEPMGLPGQPSQEWLMLRFPIRDPSGARLLGVIALDLTERRQAERVKEEFLEVLSHEFRTPLTAVSEGVRLLVDGSLGPTTKDQADILSTMTQELDRLGALLEKMMIATRLITNRVAYAFRPSDLRALLPSVLTICGPVAAAKGVRLEILPLTEPVVLAVDDEWIMEALRQIVVNAIQASPSRAAVTMAATATSHGAELWVVDTGPGIPESEQATLFERFHWTGGVNDRKTGGLGLGLFIAKSIVAAHGGVIRLHSRPGQGTRMVVTLPHRPPGPILP